MDGRLEIKDEKLPQAMYIGVNALVVLAKKYIRIPLLARVSSQKLTTMSRNGMEPLARQHSSNQWNNTLLTSRNIEDIDLRNCQCAEVLADVYPQLIFHWKAAGNMQKTVHCLIDAANAAIATNNDMEALALLHKAKEIMEQSKKTIDQA